MTDGARSGAGRTDKGFPPATPTELAPELPVPEAPIGQASSAAPADAARSDASLSAPEDPGTVVRVSTRPVEITHGSLVGEYEIESKIGEGAMGAVYSALHPILGKRVAIKVIGVELSRDANAIARFRREARAVARLKSPHIVDVFGFGELADGRAYFVMEHLTGESLHDRVVRGRVPLEEALDILDQVVRGLEAAHEAGVVHRDLKPENVFLERNPPGGVIAKLLDFGIVKIPEADADIARTQAGVLIGTPVYVAPEQICDANSVDRRADIYALGCMAYEVILGRVPFQRSTVVELVAAHLECPPPQPRSIWPDVPAALDALLFAMLAKDPAKRPTLGHVQEVIERLRQVASAPPRLATEPPPAGPISATVASLPATRQPWRVIAAGALLVIGAVVAIIALHGFGTRPSRTAVASHDAGVRIVPLPASTPGPVPAARGSVASAAAQRSAPDRDVDRSSHQPRQRPAPAAATHVSSQAASLQASASATGVLEIASKPACGVEVDGKATNQQTPFSDPAMPVGIHRVTLRNGTYGIDDTFVVQVLAGKPLHISKQYRVPPRPVDPNGTIDPFGGAP